MCLDIGLPDLQRGRIDFLEKQGALKRCVVPGYHGKGIEAQNIAAFQLSSRHRIMGAIRVDAGLEPYPGVPDFTVGIVLGNREFHCIAARHGDINFSCTCLNRVPYCGAADIGNPRAAFDECNFFCRFNHSQGHDVVADVFSLKIAIERLHLLPGSQGEMITFNTDEIGLG